MNGFIAALKGAAEKQECVGRLLLECGKGSCTLEMQGRKLQLLVNSSFKKPRVMGYFRLLKHSRSAFLLLRLFLTNGWSMRVRSKSGGEQEAHLSSIYQLPAFLFKFYKLVT